MSKLFPCNHAWSGGGQAERIARGWLRLSALMLAALACTGCGHRTWHYVTVPNASVALPEMTERTLDTRRAGQPPEPLEIAMGGDQTILIATLTHDNPKHDLDEWGRAFVVVINGPVVKGKMEITPDTGRLIVYGPIRVARRPYLGLDGSIDILSVDKNKVTAYCALRSRTLDAYEATRVLRGLYEFKLSGGTEAFLHDTGIQLRGTLVAPEPDKIAPPAEK